MTDSQMSQLGTFFRKIRLFDATIFDMAPRADSDDEAAFLDSDQDAGVLVEKLHSACTLFFCAKARLAPAKTWKDVLQFRGNRQKECIGVASVITIACSDFARPYSGSFLIEGCVHGDKPIRPCSLERWLPINHADPPELLTITFEAILPGKQRHIRRNTKHPTILKFLAEITTMPSDTSKRLRVDFCWSRKPIVKTMKGPARGFVERKFA